MMINEMYVESKLKQLSTTVMLTNMTHNIVPYQLTFAL